MSKKLLAKTVFTEKEFRKASVRDKVVMNIQQPTLQLSNRDEIYKTKLIDAFTLSSNELSKTIVIKKLRSIWQEMSYSNAVNIIDAAEDIFGPMLRRNNQILTSVLIDKSAMILDLALETGNLKQANAAIANLDKLRDKERELDNPYEDLTMPVPEFSDDPNLLTIDIPHQDVTEEE